MSESKHIKDRLRAANDFTLPAYLRRWIANANDNVSWSSSSDSSESSTSSVSSSSESSSSSSESSSSTSSTSIP